MTRGRRFTWMLGLLVGLSLALSLLPVVWAGPDQNEARQTVPTRTPRPSVTQVPAATAEPVSDKGDDSNKTEGMPTVVPDVPGDAILVTQPAAGQTPSVLVTYLPEAGGISFAWGRWGILMGVGFFMILVSLKVTHK